MINQPVYIIKNGFANVVYKENESQTSHVVHRLICGDIVGVSTLLKIRGYDYYGDIVAEEGLQCWVIEEPDLVFELYERSILRTKLEKQASSLMQMMETKFGK